MIIEELKSIDKDMKNLRKEVKQSMLKNGYQVIIDTQEYPVDVKGIQEIINHKKKNKKVKQ